MSHAANPNKPKKEKTESEAVAAAKQEKATRERIRRLIITLGDENKKVVGQIKGLVGALEDDVEEHGELMAGTVLDCAKCLPLKTGIFAAWIARMLDKQAAWAASVVTRACEELRGALAEGRPTVAQLLLRLLVCLANTGALPVPEVLGMLRQVLALSEGLRPAKGGDFGVYLTLASVLFLSPAAHGKAPTQVEDLVAGAEAYLASREARWKPLLRILKNEDLPDRLEALAAAARSLGRADWSSQAVLHVPGFEPCAEAKPEMPSLEPLGVTVEDVRKSRFRLQVPLVTSRILTRKLGNDDADDEVAEHDRWVLEDYLLTTIEMFSLDVEECSRQVLRIPLVHPHFEAIVVETVFAQLLRLPSPPQLPLFYSRLLEAMGEKQETIAKLVVQAHKALFDQAAELDDDCIEVLAEAFAYHLMHNSYSADWSSFTGEQATAQSLRLLRRTLDRLQRLSFHNNLLHRLPEAVTLHVPPEPLASNELAVQAKPEFTRMLGFVPIKGADEKKVLKYCRLLQKLPIVKEEPKPQEGTADAPAAEAATTEEASKPAGAAQEVEEPRQAEANEGKRSRDEDTAQEPEPKRPRGEEASAEERDKGEPKDKDKDNDKTTVKTAEGEDEFGEEPEEAWSLGSVGELLSAALLQCGAKTPTHMNKVLDSYQPALEQLRPADDEEAHSFARSVLRSVFAFWRLGGQRLEMTLDALLHRGLVPGRAIVEEALDCGYLLTSDGSAAWSAIHAVVRKSLENSQLARAELAAAKRAGRTEATDSCRKQLDAAVQETAEIFTLVFSGLVRSHQDLEGKDAVLRKLVLERILAVGRKYHAFIKPLIEAADSRIPGVAHNPEISSVFQSLRAL